MNAPVKNDLRESIVNETTRLFATRGFAGTSMRDVAAACACTKPALYYHYENKESLFRAVVEHHIHNIGQLIQQTVEGTGNVRDRLHQGINNMIDYCINQPLVMKLIQRIEVSPEDTAPEVDACASREMHLLMLSKLIEEGIVTGELRADLQPLDGALLIAGTIHMQFQRSVASGDWDRLRIHRTLDLVIDGIGT